MARATGISSTSYNDLILDGGAMYYGTYTDPSTPGTLLGSTRGGSSFTLEQEIREMEVDGMRGPGKGSRRITRVVAKITTNLLNMSLANLKMALVGSTSAVEAIKWDAITRQLQIATGDYIDNITWIGNVSDGTTNPVAIVLSNVIVDGNFEVSFTDKEEVVLPLTFTAHVDPATPDVEPWKIVYPNTQA